MEPSPRMGICGIPVCLVVLLLANSLNGQSEYSALRSTNDSASIVEEEDRRGVKNTFVGFEKESTNLVQELSQDEVSAPSFVDSLSPMEKSKYSWNLPGGWRIVPFGRLRGEMIYSSHQTAADAVQFFNTPANLGVDDDSFTVTAKTSLLSFKVGGPQMNGWDTGGLILINFLGPQPLRNQSGFNVVNAYGEIKNDEYRFAFGRMMDLFGPITPVTVNQGQQRGAGNIGIFRGGFQVDRFVWFGEGSKMTLSGRASQNTVNDFLLLPTSRGTDNGFPNFEGRIGLALGSEIDGIQPIEIGISGLWGETRAFDPAQFFQDSGEIVFLGALENVSTTTGLCVDFQFRNSVMGLRGEFWAAQAAGTYFVAALQSLNPVNGEGIRSIGGWIETYYKLNPDVTCHLGAGIDDPRNQDIGPTSSALNDPGQRNYNSVLWSNVIYDVNQHLQVGFELSYRETHYLNGFSSSDNVIAHFHTQLSY